MSGLILAVRYLTIIPVPGRSPKTLASLGAAAPWFPIVGLGIGLGLVAVERVTRVLFPPLLAALLTVTAWKLVTGGLHLEGLADCLDGLVGRDAAHRLSIMRDSRIGAFGAIGLILFLSLEIAALSELSPPGWWRVLLAAPVVARAVPALLARLFPPARAAGHGATFRAGLNARALPFALVTALVVAVAALGAAGVVAAAVAVLAALALGRFFTRRLSGLTGDVHGAAIEVAELAVLLTVSAWWHAQP